MAEEEQELYKIVFRGELVADMGAEEVRQNLQSRLKFSDAALDKLFSGRSIILKKDLDRPTADRYARVLWQAGARCNIEPMVSAPSIEVDRAAAPRPAPEEPPPQMVCPKCGQQQEEAEICAACGVVIAKARQRQEEAAAAQAEAPVEPAAEAASEPGPEAPGPGAEGAPLPDEGVITWPVIRALAGTRPWAQLVAVLMLLTAALGLVGGLLALVAGSRAGLPGTGFGFVVQILLFALYAIPGWYLLKYAGAIGTFLKGGTIAELETALAWQKSFWKFIGILSLVTVVLAVLGLVAALVMPGMLGMLGR